MLFRFGYWKRRKWTAPNRGFPESGRNGSGTSIGTGKSHWHNQSSNKHDISNRSQLRGQLQLLRFLHVWIILKPRPPLNIGVSWRGFFGHHLKTRPPDVSGLQKCNTFQRATAEISSIPNLLKFRDIPVFPKHRGVFVFWIGQECRRFGQDHIRHSLVLVLLGQEARQ
jgi:hypothetical protein